MPGEAKPIERIVIAGGGVAAWLAAAVLARKTRCAVTVVETGATADSLGIPMAVEATLPKTVELLAQLGIDPQALVRLTGGSFSLGRALDGLGKDGARAFHPYGDIGASLGPVGFQHLVARLRADGVEVNVSNYAVAALCAQTGRFAPPAANDRSALSTLEYGLHLETDALASLLKSEAIARGAVLIEGRLANPELSERGLIKSITLSSGQAIEAELFIDCTGPARLLSAKMPSFDFDDWSQWLPCNCSCSTTIANGSGTPPYVQIEKSEAGWRSMAATQNLLCQTLLFEGCDAADYNFTQGRVSCPWNGNCIALGGATAILAPLASTQLHLMVSALHRLTKLFPHDIGCQPEASEYNRQTTEELDNARDFVMLHQAGKSDLPETLAHRMALYESTGRVALYDEESFETWSWIALFEAQGIRPRRYDAMADGPPRAAIEAHLEQIRAAMLRAVATLPPHGDYLRTLNGGEAP